LEDKDKDVLISEQEVGYVLDFAQSLLGGSMYGAFTPQMVNSRFKDVTLNPMQATETTLTNALNSPKSSEEQLQAFSQDFEIQSQVYKKLLAYLGTMLSFDMTYSATAREGKTDYSSASYRKDLDAVKRFIDKFDYKQEFPMVVQELLRNEAYFGLNRFDMEQYVLQELPASPVYTMITGRWDYGLMYSFNLYWFIQQGVHIDMYPDFLKEKYSELWGKGGVKDYNPAIAPTSRGSSSWVYWQDIPVDKGWCFKMNPVIATRVPYYSGLFLDLIQQPQMRALQKNINMAAAARIVIGEIPLLNKSSQAGGTRDQFSISAKNLGEFLALVKSAIGDTVRTAAVPLTNVQGIEFPAENELYEKYLKTALATSGVNTNLIFTSDVRPNAIESQLSLNVDESQMVSLYPQFEKFMNYHINRLTKNHKFNFRFEGTNFFNNRQQRFDKAMQLASNGIVLPQKIAASVGMDPFEFQRQLEEAQDNKWVSKLTPLVAGYQQPGSQQDTGGRPQKKDGELSDGGEETRSNGSNIGRGGTV